jgi:hypothetical protein
MLDPLVLDSLMLEPLWLDPPVLDPFALDPLVPDPLVPDPLVPDPLVLDPLVLEPFALEPLMLEPLALEPLPLVPLVPLGVVSPRLVVVRGAPSLVTRVPLDVLPLVELCCPNAGAAASASARHAAPAVEDEVRMRPPRRRWRGRPSATARRQRAQRACPQACDPN